MDGAVHFRGSNDKGLTSREGFARSTRKLSTDHPSDGPRCRLSHSTPGMPRAPRNPPRHGYWRPRRLLRGPRLVSPCPAKTGTIGGIAWAAANVRLVRRRYHRAMSVLQVPVRWQQLRHPGLSPAAFTGKTRFVGARYQNGAGRHFNGFLGNWIRSIDNQGHR